MSRSYKPYDRDQQYLLPPSMRDWLPEGDLAYFIIDVVEELDLSAIHTYYERDTETGQEKAASGQPPYHPEMMVALLLYAYSNDFHFTQIVLEDPIGGPRGEITQKRVISNSISPISAFNTQTGS